MGFFIQLGRRRSFWILFLVVQFENLAISRVNKRAGQELTSGPVNFSLFLPRFAGPSVNSSPAWLLTLEMLVLRNRAFLMLQLALLLTHKNFQFPARLLTH